jgi:hypothetical protein
LKIPPFGDLYRKVKHIAFKKKLLKIQQDRELEDDMRPFLKLQKTKWNPIQPVLPLVKIPPAEHEADKTKLITFELKLRAGAAAGTTTYKKAVRIFDEGSPQDWMDLLKSVNEIWKQNSVNGAHDRAATINAALKGDSLTAFEAALEEARVDPDPDEADPMALTIEHVEIALKAVTNIVFPHRALEIQKLWMNRAMRKPNDMQMRMCASAVSRINNCLPLFPHGTPESKFTEEELVGLLEWSLPPAWRAKFDLKGFVPSLHTREKLIEECEAIERSERATREAEYDNKNNKNNEKKKVVKFADGNKKRGDKNNAPFFCKECGRNRTHATADCYVLKNRAKREDQAGGANGDIKAHAKPFSKRTFRKEVNALARKAGTKGALDLYASALKREEAKQAKIGKKHAKKRDADNDDSSDSDASVHNLEGPIPRKKAKLEPKGKKHKESKILAEEKAFLKKVAQAEKEEDSDTSSEEEFDE